MSRRPLRLAVDDAARRLEEAGVPSARNDAEELAAFALGVPRPRLGLVPLVGDDVLDGYRGLIARRCGREPLQHIVGSAPMGRVEVAVGPGVFVPRFETELLLEWAVAEIDRCRTADGTRIPVVLDLCAGSGALGLAIAHERPVARVYGVESEPSALRWARANADARARAGDAPITLVAGDVCDRALLTELEGGVDVIVANPPYVPDGASLDVEVAEYDPPTALFAGRDGLAVIRPIVANAARWLRIGGAAAVEHDDSNGGATAGLFRSRRVFSDVAEHEDLAGRPRFVTARRAATDAEAALMHRQRPRSGAERSTDGKQ